MTNSILDQILEAIQHHSTIIVHRHMRPDPDAIGSQCGLVEILKETYPAKKILKAGESVGDLNYLAMMDEVSDEDYEDALVIVTDTANRPRISDQRYDTGKTLIKIDHHPKDDSYGDIEWVDTKASSCSEMIASLYLYLEEHWKMPNEAARLLYAGIIGDTGRFLYPSTTPTTMRIVAGLMEYPIQADQLNQKMNTVSQKVAKLSGHVLKTIEMSSNGVGKVILTNELLEEYQITDADTSAIVSLPGTVEGILLWGIFVEQPEGYFRCRLRSKGPEINQVAKEHHGGGHPLASGANAKNMEEVNQIVEKFEILAEDWHKES